MGNLHAGDTFRLIFYRGHSAADCFNITSFAQPLFEGGAQ